MSQATSAVSSWDQQHDNGDATEVVALDLRGDGFVALAIDLDQQGEVLETAAIAATKTEAEAVERAKAWLDENPKGIAGGGGLSAIGGMLGG